MNAEQKSPGSISSSSFASQKDQGQLQGTFDESLTSHDIGEFLLVLIREATLKRVIPGGACGAAVSFFVLQTPGHSVNLQIGCLT